MHCVKWRKWHIRLLPKKLLVSFNDENDSWNENANYRSFKQLGLLNSNAEAWKHANRYATNTDVLKTVLAFGLTQTCCAVSQHIKIFKVAATASVESRKFCFTVERGILRVPVPQNLLGYVWEMLKGDRSEVVRDATVLSPVSILFCTDLHMKAIARNM